jgi:dTDP-glucose pyrophosphorylase
LERIIEKPDEATLAAMPRPLWVSMNCWRFGPKIFKACRSIGLSPRGEYELTAAVQYAIDALDEPFKAVLVRDVVLDLSRREDIAPVAARLKGTIVRL